MTGLMRKTFIQVAAALSMLACGTAEEAIPDAAKPQPAVEKTTALPSATSATPPPSAASSAVEPAAPKPAEASPEDVAEAIKGNNAFALALYAKLAGEKGNLFISPASISTALGMTYAGARGETEAEMAKTLRFTLGQSKLHPALGTYIRRLNAGGEKAAYELRAANRLWGQKGYGFLQPFLDIASIHYGAGLAELDFAGDPEAARATINQWADESTRGKIKDLLDPTVIKPTTRLVLTNAIYFKGTWVSQFDKADTADEPFLVDGARKTPAPTMHKRNGSFKFAEQDGVAALEMPYTGGALSMVILLPSKPNGLRELEKKLSPESLDAWARSLSPEKVDVAVPRFTLTRAVELSAVLSAMGMPSAFGPKADLSGLSGKTDLFISAVVHKAFVDVNEEGTEAAAATAVVTGRKNGHSKPPRVFKADHPFVFVIRDVTTGSILFLGRVTDPKG